MVASQLKPLQHVFTALCMVAATVSPDTCVFDPDPKTWDHAEELAKRMEGRVALDSDACLL